MKKIVNMEKQRGECTNRTDRETYRNTEKKSAEKKTKNSIKSLKLKLLCFVKVLRAEAL